MKNNLKQAKKLQTSIKVLPVNGTNRKLKLNKLNCLAEVQMQKPKQQ